MKPRQILDVCSEKNRFGFLVVVLLLLGAVVVIDGILLPQVSLGVFYIFPILLAAGFLSRWQLVGLALFCAILREVLGPFPMGMESILRVLLGLAAFIGMGLFVFELARNRQMALFHLKQIQEETQLRKELEKELQVLVKSSPAAILILDEQRRILLGNPAACRMFGLDPECMGGKTIDPYLPVLKDLQEMSRSLDFRQTEMESTGRRLDGQVFRAHLWISAYAAGSGVRFAVISIDVSDELRDREEAGVDRLLSNSRVLVGAVAHEIRNLCGAIGVAHANLMRQPGLADSDDFKALGSLVEGLRRLASAELRPLAKDRLSAVPLSRILEDLRIVIQPTFDEIDATVSWELPPALPYVWADAQSLLQIFLNLTQNSYRAMKVTVTKTLTIAATSNAESVTIKVSDTGLGVPHPEHLFRPFQEGAASTGLGLYLSRAIARSFGGDLRFEPRTDGACFIVELPCADREARESA